MPGPIIYSGPNSPKFTENWDKIFAKKNSDKSATQAKTKEKASKDTRPK